MLNRNLISTSLLVMCLGPGCATILNGPNQMVAFNSEPDGATVAVDGVKMGKTPCVLPVPRKGWDKIITFSKDGHKTVNYKLRNTLSGAVIANVLVPIVGTVVDAISGRGGGYADSVSVLLEPGTGIVSVDPKEEAKKAKENNPKAATAQSPEATVAEAAPPLPE